MTPMSYAQSLLVRLFHGGFPGAVVAGGFLRDVALGVEPKDLDIFIPHQAAPTRELEARLTSALGFSVTMQCDLSYGEDSEIDRVFTQGLSLTPPVQIIELVSGADPAERASRHDFGLCLAHMGADGVVHQPDAFTKDMLSRTCTLVYCETENEHKRSMRRWARWSAGTLGAMGFKLVDETEWKGMHQ